MVEQQMSYYAHTREDGEKQLLKTHLENVAKLASSFAFGSLKRSAELAGILHDIGKYQPSFQKKLEGQKISIEHSACGAYEIKKQMRNPMGALLEFIISGHHSGLPDFGAAGDDADGNTLCAKLHEKREREDYSAFQNEITSLPLKESEEEIIKFVSEGCSSVEELSDRFEFLTRYLYSCLVDADFLDTEEFCQGKRQKVREADFEECLTLLTKKLSSFRASTALQKARNSLQAQALTNVEKSSPLYLLNIPTGSGKTICSMNLALKIANREGKKRIIYVIPYTSIIEQTAEVFESLFPNAKILQHHSDYVFEEKTKNASKDEPSMQKAAENWDASIIITTNVQFFESIYDNHSSRLRKFHNMADSVIVFDEIHTLPIDLFVPCMKAVEQLTTRYQAKAIFLTATMPDFASLVEKYVGRKWEMVPLVPIKEDFVYFEKCKYEWLEGELLSDLNVEKNNLLIFNKRKTAEKYYREYEGKKYYLSTYLTPVDRSKKIAEIKEILAEGKEKIAVFSTSLIEAGVDVDFDVVYRELNGIDSILQSGGRCNREGKRSKEESLVKLFETEGNLSREMQKKANIAKGCIKTFGVNNIASEECIRAYFDELYAYFLKRSDKKTGESVTNENFYQIKFATKADNFNLIDSTTVSVAIPCEEIAGEIEKLKLLGFADRRLIRKYSASVNYKECEKLMASGVVSLVEGCYLLTNPTSYSSETGLSSQLIEEDYFY